MTAADPEFDLLTEPRAGYLFARVRTVGMTMEVVHKLLLDLRNALIDTRRGRLLFEYELAFAMSPDETFELMNGMMRMFPGMRIAFVTSDPRHQMSLDSGIHVSIAAGQEHQSFTDPAAAEEWLLQPSDD